MLFFARLCKSIITYKPIIIKMPIEMNWLRFEPMDFRFRSSFTSEPVDQEKPKSFRRHKFTCTQSKKTFVDIWYGPYRMDHTVWSIQYGLREKWLSRVVGVKKSYLKWWSRQNLNMCVKLGLTTRKLRRKKLLRWRHNLLLEEAYFFLK